MGATIRYGESLTFCNSDLFEPNLEIGIENRDKRRRFLPGTLGNSEEIRSILRSKKLARCIEVLREERVNKSRGVVKFLEALQDTEFSPSVYACEALLDPPQPISGQIAQTEVDPAVLVSNVHEADHAKCDLFVGHITKVESNATILLPSKPWLREILV